MSSVIADDVSAVRAKITDSLREQDTLQQALAAIPGWLQVGDPSRFNDIADQDVARKAQDQRERLAEAIREQQRLRARLDDLYAGDSNPPPPNATYGVLLPVRLETRFCRPVEGARRGSRKSRWLLRIRVEPDPVSLAPAAAPASAQERQLVVNCWQTAGGDLSTDDGATAFGVLAGQVGAPRAAFLLRTVEIDRGENGFTLVESQAPPAARLLVGLPPRLEIWADDGNGLAQLFTLEPQRDVIEADFNLEAVRPRRSGTIPRRWWNSYDQAVKAGLAGEFLFGEEPPQLRVLLCVGHAAADETVTPAELLAAHTDAGKLGTLSPLTPTNTVDGQPTTDLGRDPTLWLQVARQPLGPVGGLASSLTGTPLAAGIPTPDQSRQIAADALVRALWPVLWQRTLKDLVGLGEEIYRLGDYAGRHLHPFGPLPVLRVGDLPYGVLPTAAYSQWARRAGDPQVEQTIAEVIAKLIEPLRAAAATHPTAAGADAERLLQVLAAVPTSRDYGSRNYPATAIWAALWAAISGTNPMQLIQEWDDQARTFLGLMPFAPARRHSPALFVEALPRRHILDDFREPVRRYLEASWGELAEVEDISPHWTGDDGLRSDALARLIRHSLLLTQVEMCRLVQDGVAAPLPTTYLVPLDRPQQLYSDATSLEGTGRVRDVPPTIVSFVDGSVMPHIPRCDAVVRQFEDVRDAVETLLAADPTLVQTVLNGVLDAAGHRVDVWLTALAARRLTQLAANDIQPVIGAYGWVDHLQPAADPTPPTSAGLVHAPSYSQALTAAVLRDHVVHDPGDARWQMTLDSASVRAAAQLADDVRSGIDLSEVLGREIERRYPDPNQVLELRTQFHARPEWEGRRVCDGQRVLDATGPHATPAEKARVPNWLPPESLDDFRQALDAYADLLVTDAVHDVVDGRPEAAAESMEAAAGLAAPPELRMLRTPREAGSVRTDVRFAIPWQSAWEQAPIRAQTHPVEVADPAFARWIRKEVGPTNQITWTDANAHDPGITLLQLEASILDTLVTPHATLERRAAKRLNATNLGGTGHQVLAQVARLSTLLGAGTPTTDSAADLLRARLARLRGMAQDLLAALAAATATAPRLRRWGLDDDPTIADGQLRARLERINQPPTDANADTELLAERIRTLLPTYLPLPLVCPEQLPTLHPNKRLLEEWLPVTAAVRPALANLEAATLLTTHGWRAATTDKRPDPWAPPPLTKDRVSTDQQTTIIVGPGVAARPTRTVRGVVRLDSWGETVPAPRHTTWTAFGYDAPRARAPQAILLAIPADLDQPLTTDQLLNTVLETRSLAHARSLTAETPDALAIGVPTSVVEAVGNAACTLTEEPL